MFQVVADFLRVIDRAAGNITKAHDCIQRCADIVRHTGQKIRFCLVGTLGFFCSTDPVAFPSLLIADQTRHIQNIGDFAFIVAAFDNKTVQMPVAIFGQIFNGEGLFLP